MYNFDAITPRQGTDSIKYDNPHRRGKPQGLLPLWVADMDFPAPPCVLEALQARLNHGVFGYTEPSEGYFAAVCNWQQTRHSWAVQPGWVVPSPGVVFALYVAVRAFTTERDAVLIQQPVYNPFTAAALNNARRLAVNRLVYDGRRYTIDFEDFERQITTRRVKLFILCNPHNPVGRVWSAEELSRMGEICLRHNVIVVSDEIHQDFVYKPHKHAPFASVSDALRDITITTIAPTKTFNMAGLQAANIIIPNTALRERFSAEHAKSGYSQLNAMGLAAAKAAYLHGAPWLDELTAYLAANRRRISAFLERRLPKVRLVEPEATYLAWLDCSALNQDDKTLDNLITNRAKLWLSPGATFGEGGQGFLRLNYAAPSATIDEALTRLQSALSDL